MPEVKLVPEEMAVSAFRTFCYCAGVEPDFDKLGDEEQGRWMALARSCERTLEELDGKSFNIATEALADIWGGHKGFYERLPRDIQVAWMGTTRHLATLLESDEIDSLDTAERFWGEWAQKRRRNEY